jgi:hypothetical protein
MAIRPNERENLAVSDCEADGEFALTGFMVELIYW